MKTKFRNRILSVITATVMMFTVVMPVQEVKAADSDLPSATNISFASARDLEFDTSISEDVEKGDNLRYYKFSLSEASELVVRGNYAARSWNRYFYLYDSSMTQLTAVEGYDSFNASFNLTGGDYYLKFDSDDDYKFVASVNPLKESFVETQTTNNNTVSNASLINLMQQYKGVLALNDDIDYYRFEVEKDGTVTIDLTNATNGKFKYAIYDKSLNSVHVNTVSKNEKIIGEKVILSEGTYYFAVKKENNSNGIGSYNFQLDYTAKAPDVPKIKSVKNSSVEKMTVKWGKVENADGYELQYSTNSKFKENIIKKAISRLKANAEITKLEKGKTYYVRMRTYIKVNDAKKYSKWSKIVKVEITK